MNPKHRKILFINPWEGEMFPPPAIGYIQGATRSVFGNAVDTRARDLTNALELLKTEEFDLVCVSFHSFSVKHARKIRDAVKRGTLVCGGHHPSSLPQQMIGLGYDQVVIGEGENAIIDIVSGDSSQIITGGNSYFKSVNDMPFPDYSGLTGTWKNTGSETGYPVISSRGCPFTCNFCASSAFWNKNIHMRSPQSVISELAHNIESYGMNNWMFEDDNFTLSKSRAKEICALISSEINAKYGMRHWQCASRAESLRDVELCKALLNAGCTTVWIGVESFSQSALDRCEKNTTVEKMVAGIEMAESVGLKTMCQFIIGLPGDTADDISKTVDVIKRTRMSRWGCNIAWVLPNTSIYENAKKHGFSDETYLESGAPYYTYETDMTKLLQYQNMINSAKI